jgi:hypothetical protein
MQGLVESMMHINPAERPLIEDVVANFSSISGSLSGSKLRSPLVSKHKSILITIFRLAKQALITFTSVLSSCCSQIAIYYSCGLHEEHASYHTADS